MAGKLRKLLKSVRRKLPTVKKTSAITDETIKREDTNGLQPDNEEKKSTLRMSEDNTEGGKLEQSENKNEVSEDKDQPDVEVQNQQMTSVTDEAEHATRDAVQEVEVEDNIGHSQSDDETPENKDSAKIEVDQDLEDGEIEEHVDVDKDKVEVDSPAIEEELKVYDDEQHEEFDESNDDDTLGFLQRFLSDWRDYCSPSESAISKCTSVLLHVSLLMLFLKGATELMTACELI